MRITDLEAVELTPITGADPTKVIAFCHGHGKFKVFADAVLSEYRNKLDVLLEQGCRSYGVTLEDIKAGKNVLGRMGNSPGSHVWHQRYFIDTNEILRVELTQAAYVNKSPEYAYILMLKGEPPKTGNFFLP